MGLLTKSYTSHISKRVAYSYACQGTDHSYTSQGIDQGLYTSETHL